MSNEQFVSDSMQSVKNFKPQNTNSIDDIHLPKGLKKCSPHTSDEHFV